MEQHLNKLNMMAKELEAIETKDASWGQGDGIF
jgi:hypothetical protein